MHNRCSRSTCYTNWWEESRQTVGNGAYAAGRSGNAVRKRARENTRGVDPPSSMRGYAGCNQGTLRADEPAAAQTLRVRFSAQTREKRAQLFQENRRADARGRKRTA